MVRVLGVTIGVVLLIALFVLAPTEDRSEVRVTASSSGPGSDPGGLLPDVPRSQPAAPDDTPTWRSKDEAVGAWVQVEWPRPRTVSRVSLTGAANPEPRISSAVLTFDEGSSLLITPDSTGNADVHFPPRTITTARLTVAGVAGQADWAALDGLSVDDSPGTGSPGAGASTPPVPTASSTQDTPASSLVDGDIAEGDTGQEWQAAGDDAAPWVQLTWLSPQELASVQLLGPSSTLADAVDRSLAPLHGVLRFSDGSSVVLSGIAGGERGPTTIAFTPRMSSWIRVELQKTVPSATSALREIAAHDAGTTPPRWPVQDPATRYETDPPRAVNCDAATPAGRRPASGRITLVCPAPGSAVDGPARIVVAAPPGTDVQAKAWRGDVLAGAGTSPPRALAFATADADGRAVLDVDTGGLPHGPVTVEVSAVGSTRGDVAPVSVQLINRGGQVLDSPGFAPAGMTLQWSEEFTAPLSVSSNGSGAVYAAAKPEAGGASQFGDAVFADPADGAGTLSTVEGEYLRIRAEPIGDRVVNATWGQDHVSGLISSLHVGASGFAAQYGYFEARMMGAPGRGTWPAFWMLNTEAAARDTGTAAEVDAVELYGHNPYGSCHTAHNWGTNADESGAAQCDHSNGFSDWTMTWHSYGARILPGGASFFIDGTQVASYTGLTHTEQPFFFLLNLALGGGWPVDLSATSGTTDLYVDWIRVYT